MWSKRGGREGECGEEDSREHGVEVVAESVENGQRRVWSAGAGECLE